MDKMHFHALREILRYVQSLSNPWWIKIPLTSTNFQHPLRPNGAYFLGNQQRYLLGYLALPIDLTTNSFSPSFCPPWTALRYWGPDPARHPSWLHSHCRVQGSSILVAKEGDQAFKYNNCFSWRWPVESEIIQGSCKDGREWNVSSLLDGCNCSSSSKFEC